MTYTVAHGPPDIEAIHQWNNGSPLPPAINNQGNTYPPTLPYVRLDGITGWRSLPESDDFRAPRTNADGEVTYPGRLLGKTVVYEGRVMARDMESLRSTMAGLTRGFGNMSTNGTMTVTPYAWIGGPVWTFTARVLSFDADRDFEWNRALYVPFRHSFQLNLRMADPRFYSGGIGYL